VSTTGPSLGRFLLRTFAWLPLCFAAWYFGAAAVSAASGSAAGLIIRTVAPRVLDSVERTGPMLEFVTYVEVQPEPGRKAVLVAEVNALVYTYGLALFAALMLAARAAAWKVLAGAVMLLPFQAWGIAFDVLTQVGIKQGPAIAQQAGISGARAEFIALAYQLGVLVLPTLAPVLLWAAWCRDFVATQGTAFRRVARAP
jgi:hypothetical protein